MSTFEAKSFTPEGPQGGLQVEEEQELTPEEMKQVEQEVIQRQIEKTEAQLETLEAMERNCGNLLEGMMDLSPEALEAAGIHVTNVMQFNATLELSAPRDVSKLYNFSGLKSNLPRDDINLQFCRGALKQKKQMLKGMKQNSQRRKSLLDAQTLLLLKSQEESNLVAEKMNFWRKAALNVAKEQKPQFERDPEWLADYTKNKLGTKKEESQGFWKKVEQEEKAKEGTPDLKKGLVNVEKKRRKEESWEVSLSDDTWYRAPQFHPQVSQARRTDIEVLCEVIFSHGERYEDGTAAIGFTWLFKMFNRANIAAILIKAKKHGLVFFDGEIVFASVRSDDDDEFVVLQKPIGEIRRAFSDMRSRHADMFEFDGRRRPTIVLPEERDTDDEDSEDLSD